MEGRNNSLLVFETVLYPAGGEKAHPHDARLDISVVFTSVKSTLAALRRAATLANSLRGRITLLVPQVVPYPLPLESPPVLLDWNERRFRTIAAESPVETTVRIYLCRDPLDTLRSVLRSRSIVILGGRDRWWWHSAEGRLVRQLRKAGHEAILTGTE
jgi:hypothetical protein